MQSTTEAGLLYTAALEELRRLASVREAGSLGLDRALRIICDTIGTPMAKVLELKPAGDLLIVRAGIGWREGIVGCATVPAAQSSSAGYVLAHDGAIIFEDIQRTRRFTDATLLRSHGVTSSIAVRIMRGGIVLGVLSVHELRERRFGAREAKFLEAATPSVAELMREPSPCISKL